MIIVGTFCGTMNNGPKDDLVLVPRTLKYSTLVVKYPSGALDYLDWPSGLMVVFKREIQEDQHQREPW